VEFIDFVLVDPLLFVRAFIPPRSPIPLLAEDCFCMAVVGDCGGIMFNLSSHTISLGIGIGYSRSRTNAAVAAHRKHDVMVHLDPKNGVHELSS
jgi:hypothetical protein